MIIFISKVKQRKHIVITEEGQGEDSTELVAELTRRLRFVSVNKSSSTLITEEERLFGLRSTGLVSDMFIKYTLYTFYTRKLSWIFGIKRKKK